MLTLIVIINKIYKIFIQKNKNTLRTTLCLNETTNKRINWYQTQKNLFNIGENRTFPLKAF